MPQIEAKIVSFRPLKVTDDDRFVLELPALEPNVRMHTPKKGQTAKLVLQDWVFETKPSESNQELRIEVVAENFRVDFASASKGSRKAVPEEDKLVNMLEDQEVK